jgi:hypothetical protein
VTIFTCPEQRRQIKILSPPHGKTFCGWSPKYALGDKALLIQADVPRKSYLHFVIARPAVQPVRATHFHLKKEQVWSSVRVVPRAR